MSKSGKTFWGHITRLWCWFFLNTPNCAIPYFKTATSMVLVCTIFMQWFFLLCHFTLWHTHTHIHRNLHAPTTKHLLACISSPSVEWVFGAWGFLLNFTPVRFVCGIWKVSIDHRFFTAPQGAWTLKRRRWRRKRRRNQPWLPERGRKNRS